MIARVRDGSEWSGPLTGNFIIGVPASAANLVVSELMYHPTQATTAEINVGFIDEESFEYIEFTNIGPVPIELAGVIISAVFEFNFSAMEIASGGRFLLVRDQAAFEFRHGAGFTILGEYGDSKLSNGGERIVSTENDASVIKDFIYDGNAPWPDVADGSGPSLTLIQPDANPDHSNPANWRASGFAGGSPGASDSTTFSGDPLADANANGIANLVEYAVGDELVAGFAMGGTLAFRLNLLADDVIVAVETSTDLSTWQTGASAVILSEQIYHADGTATVRWQTVGSASDRKFMRVRVTTR